MKIPDLKLDEKHTKDVDTADLETAIRLTRFGKFHIFLIIIGGLCFLCSGFEYGLHAYTLPYAQCDLKITTSQVGVINAMFLGGSITSSFISGALADIVGRKRVIVCAMFLDGIATIVASWSPNYIMFALVRFISGFMSGAPGCLVFSYAGEFCADSYRSRGICTIGFNWTLAWLLLPGLAWMIIPSSLAFYTPIFEYATWRVFVLFIGLFNLIVAIVITFFLTETPKFLFVQGRQAEAIRILQLMYRKNTGNAEEEYPVKRLVAKYSDTEENANKPESEPAEPKKNLKDIFIQMGKQIKLIFGRANIKRTILCAAIYFSNFFGYYGLGLWLPELFNRFGAYYAQHPNETVTVCELSHFQITKSGNDSLLDVTASSIANFTHCGERSLNLAVFSNTFIIGAACCTGNIVAIFLTNKIGGRLLSVASMLIAGICAILVYFSRSKMQIVAVNCFFMAGVGTGMITIGSCVVNLFPTSVRAMGVSVGLLFGRLGAVISNLIFGLLLDISCEVPIFFLGGTIIMGALICLLLPKNSQKAAE